MTKNFSPLFLKRPIKKLSIDWRDDACWLWPLHTACSSQCTVNRWWCQMLGKCISGIRISKILLGEDPDPPHGLRNFGARRVGLHTTWSAPQAKNPSYAPAVSVTCMCVIMHASAQLRDSVNMEEEEETQFLSRLCSIPLVSSTLNQLSAFYSQNKLSNNVIRLACETAEFGIRVAASTTKPLLYRLEPQSQYWTVAHYFTLLFAWQHLFVQLEILCMVFCQSLKCL